MRAAKMAAKTIGNAGRWLGFALVACALAALVSAVAMSRNGDDEAQWLGIEAEPLTDDMRLGLRLYPGQNGVVVSDVVGIAAAAGVREGDVITAIDGRAVVDVETFREASEHATRAMPAGGGIAVAVNRLGAPLVLFIGSTRPNTPPIGPPVAQPPGVPVGRFANATPPPVAANTVAAPRPDAVQIPELGMEVVATAAGVSVHRIYRGSWAEHGGLATSDVISSFNAAPVGNIAQLVHAVSAAPPEQAASLTIARGGVRLTKKITVGEGELQGVTVPADAAAPFAQRAAAGAQAAPASLLIKQLGIAVTSAPSSGAVVTGVMGKSYAQTAGLRAGDVVIGCGRKTVRDAQHLQRLLGLAAPEAYTRLRVLRNGTEKTVRVMVGEGEMEGFLPIPKR